MFEVKKQNNVVVRFQDPYQSQNALDTMRVMNGFTSTDDETRAERCATEISQFMAPFPALNNNATWDTSAPKGAYEQIAKQIDKQENQIIAQTQFNPDDVDWWIDSGLMASLVGGNRGGNCDDLASFALALGIASYGGCTLCLAQLQNISHSFVLVQSKADRLWALDTWVAKDRVTPYKDTLWAKYDKNQNLIMHVVEVIDGVGVDIAKLWYEWLEVNTRKRGRVRSGNDTPRLNQVGKYYHPSAKDASSSGL